jgi:glycosyltransferase involved in cell wall biosynthesis
MIIVLSNAPFLGGAEYQLLDLISGLADKYRIKVICPGSSPMKPKLGGSVEFESLEFGNTLGKFRGLNMFSPKNLTRLRKLRKILSSVNPKTDVIITYDYKELLLVGVTGTKLKHIHFQHPELPKWLRLNPLLRSLAVKYMNQTDRVVVDCNAILKHLEGFGVKKDSIQVIYNGVDEKLFLPAKPVEENKIRKELGLRGSVVGINARLNAGKGYETLIDAFSKVHKSFPNVTLLSVGEGNPLIQKKIYSQVDKAGLSDSVRFMGRWDRTKIPKFYKALDVFVLPSESEGLPLSIIEAMLSGLPVIATTVGGIPEEIIDGRTGYLIQPKDSTLLADAIIKLLKDKSLSQKMGQEGRRSALSKFSKNKMIESTLDLIEDLGVTHENSN